MSRNPYAPPKRTVADAEPREAAPALWNPSAAANWSLLFSPVFGAFLYMKNWQALGEPAKAFAAKVWVAVIVCALIGLPLAVTLIPGMGWLDNFASTLELVLLIAWYVGVARSQERYVKGRFGKSYPRRGWGKPLLIAFSLLFAYGFAVGIVAVLALAGAGIAGG